MEVLHLQWCVSWHTPELPQVTNSIASITDMCAKECSKLEETSGLHNCLKACARAPVILMQGQSEDVSEQLNEEEQLLVISRLHQVS